MRWTHILGRLFAGKPSSPSRRRALRLEELTARITPTNGLGLTDGDDILTLRLGTGGADDTILSREAGSGTWWQATPQNGTLVTRNVGQWSSAVVWDDIFSGDFDNDGRLDDIVGRARGSGDWWAGLNNGQQLTNTAFGRWSSAVTWDDVAVGDFDGDGFDDDLIGRVRETGDWWMARSNGSAFQNVALGRWSATADWDMVRVGDFDNNGIDDIIGSVGSSGEWWVGLSNGTSLNTRLFGRWSTAVNWDDVSIGDFDRDGFRDDVVGRTNGAGEWWGSFSNGSSLTTRSLGAWRGDLGWDVMTGDFDGDGDTDIMGRETVGGTVWIGFAGASGLTTQFQTTYSAAVSWDGGLIDLDGDGRVNLTGRVRESGEWWGGFSQNGTLQTRQVGRWSSSADWDVNDDRFSRGFSDDAFEDAYDDNGHGEDDDIFDDDGHHGYLPPGGGGGGGGGVTQSGPTINEIEANSVRSQANAFTFGALPQLTLNGTSLNQDDKDFFRFTAPATRTLLIQVQNPGGGPFAQFEIENEPGTAEFDTEPNDGINSGSFQLVGGATYFIRMRAKDNVASPYTVVLTLA